MTHSEKLDFLLTEIVGMRTESQGMKIEFQGMKTDTQNMKTDVRNIQSDIKSLNARMDNLEFQLRPTERILRSQITKFETLILGEVERVHLILDQHIHDQTMYTALVQSRTYEHV